MKGIETTAPLFRTIKNSQFISSSTVSLLPHSLTLLTFIHFTFPKNSPFPLPFQTAPHFKLVRCTTIPSTIRSSFMTFHTIFPGVDPQNLPPSPLLLLAIVRALSLPLSLIYDAQHQTPSCRADVLRFGPKRRTPD